MRTNKITRRSFLLGLGAVSSCCADGVRLIQLNAASGAASGSTRFCRRAAIPFTAHWTRSRPTAP